MGKIFSVNDGAIKLPITSYLESLQKDENGEPVLGLEVSITTKDCELNSQCLIDLAPFCKAQSIKKIEVLENDETLIVSTLYTEIHEASISSSDNIDMGEAAVLAIRFQHSI